MTDHSDNYQAFSELYPLVIASLTGEITPAQVSQLEELVCRDPQTRRLYAQLIYESVNLRTWAESAREERADEAPMPSSVARPRRPAATMSLASAVVAALLLACVLGRWMLMSSTEDEPATSSNRELELETMAVVQEAQSVLGLLDELERENATVVRVLGQDAGAEPKGDSEEQEPA